MKTRRIALVLAVLLASLTLCLAPILSSNTGRAYSADLPLLGNAPDFTLTDHTGAPFSAQSLAGKVWVVDFIFTSCPGICPIMTTAMTELQRHFQNEPDLRFVSISVDPQTDTPEVLARFAERYGADPARWRFLTGQGDTTARLSFEGFKIGSLENPLNHSSRFVLIDRHGQIRGYYDGTDEADVEQIKREIPALLAEKP